ncbi:guanylate-binding protein 1-like isoform X2 [Mercenaria mercenaria]|uniref:guanylate-binding protein 1-like isoform X2 n=1 Tax=Mercenaria mercenaria TaxID=6596 RepID=UPI00234E8026|nr:guanylate-binding protein 1-like isoform X2 [Mercenaria mercenaria]
MNQIQTFPHHFKTNWQFLKENANQGRTTLRESLLVHLLMVYRNVNRKDKKREHRKADCPVYQRLKIFHGPVQLISTTKDGTLRQEYSTINEISQIYHPVVVVAVTGLYRQGKSYLLNKIAKGTSDFAVGHTFQPKTKGIWAMCKEHPKQENTVLMLLDTEGQGDVMMVDRKHDNRIATLTLLLCDALCYNTMGVISQDTIEKVSDMADLTKIILDKNSPRRLKHKWPTFVLCLRDFYLEPRKGDKLLSADEYLEECLTLCSCDTDHSEIYDKPRKCIKETFSNRKCFTFDFPTECKQMNRLNTLQDNELNAYFLEDVEEFVSYIFEIKPKVLQKDRKVNGSAFATFLKCHLEAIHAEIVPDVTDALLESFDKENKELVQTTVEEYQNRLNMIQLPVLCEGVMDRLICDEFLEMELTQFRRKAKLDIDRSFEQNARRLMNLARDELRRRNAAQIYKHCFTNISELYEKSIEDRKKYFKSGGYVLYKSDIASITWTYMNHCKDLDETERNRAFVTFMDSKSNEEHEIMTEDSRITKENERTKQKMIEEERCRQGQEELLQQRLEEFSKIEENMALEMRSDQIKMFEIRNRDIQNNTDFMRKGSLVCPKCEKWLCASWKNYNTPCGQ